MIARILQLKGNYAKIIISIVIFLSLAFRKNLWQKANMLKYYMKIRVESHA